jgi:hypothetical protein
MDCLAMARAALDELPQRWTSVSISHVDKEYARDLRVRVSREATKRGWTVFTKLVKDQLMIWRVE